MKEIISEALRSLEIEEIVRNAENTNTKGKYVNKIGANFIEKFNTNNQGIYNATKYTICHHISSNNHVVISEKGDNNCCLVHFVYARSENPPMNQRITQFFKNILLSEQDLGKKINAEAGEYQNCGVKACYTIFITANKNAWEDTGHGGEIDTYRLSEERKFTSEEIKKMLQEKGQDIEGDISKSKKYTCNWCDFVNSGQGYRFLIFEVK